MVPLWKRRTCSHISQAITWPGSWLASGSPLPLVGRQPSFQTACGPGIAASPVTREAARQNWQHTWPSRTPSGDFPSLSSIRIRTLIDDFLAEAAQTEISQDLLPRFMYWPVAGGSDYVHTLPFLDYTTPMSPYAAAQRFLEPCYMAWPYLGRRRACIRTGGHGYLDGAVSGRPGIWSSLSDYRGLGLPAKQRFRKQVLRRQAPQLTARQFFNSSFNQLNVQAQLERRYSFENKIAPFCLNRCCGR